MCMSESTKRTSHFKSKLYNCSDSSSTVFHASHFHLNETKMQRAKDSSFCKQYLFDKNFFFCIRRLKASFELPVNYREWRQRREREGGSKQQRPNRCWMTLILVYDGWKSHYAYHFWQLIVTVWLTATVRPFRWHGHWDSGMHVISCRSVTDWCIATLQVLLEFFCFPTNLKHFSFALILRIDSDKNMYIKTRQILSHVIQPYCCVCTRLTRSDVSLRAEAASYTGSIATVSLLSTHCWAGIPAGLEHGASLTHDRCTKTFTIIHDIELGSVMFYMKRPLLVDRAEHWAKIHTKQKRK